MPYRIDISFPPDDALDQLVQLGALDIEPVDDGIAAIIPDAVTPEAVARVFGTAGVTVSPAVARDNGSVWLLSPRAVRIGHILIAPPEVPAQPGLLRLTDSTAFGTGRVPGGPSWWFKRPGKVRFSPHVMKRALLCICPPYPMVSE